MRGFGSSELNAKVACRAYVGSLGPLVIVVSGGWIVHVWLAPTVSIAVPDTLLTSNVAEPAPRPEYVFGEVHACQPPGSPPRLHWNVTPGVLDENEKDADVSYVVEAGPLVISVSGAV